MTPALDITTAQRKTLLTLLRRFIPGVIVWAYGSRVKWTARPNSDLDLVAFTTPAQNSRVSELKEALAESNLPFPVDLHVWDEVPERFHAIIRKEYVVIQEAEEKQPRELPAGWREIPLGNFVTLQRGHDLTGPERKSGSVPVMGSAGMNGYHNTAKAKGPGVVVGRSGASFGQVHYCPVDYWPHNTALYVTDFRGNDTRFTYYFLKSIDFTRYNSGSAQASLNRNFIYPIPVRVPEPREQHAIASVLGALDDKIELNRRMNETLEALAQSLFKSWFVDATQAALPKGWREGTVGEDFDITMGQSPPGETYNEIGEGLPFFQGRADFGSRFPSLRVFCTAPTRIANPGDTLVCVRAPVGDLNMATQKCCIGRGLAAVRHKTGSRSYTYYAMGALHEVFDSFEAGGTVFGSINKKDFHAIKQIIPPAEKVKEFEALASPLDQRILNNEEESRTLAALRDALLPKLLSGELRLPSQGFGTAGVPAAAQLTEASA